MRWLPESREAVAVLVGLMAFLGVLLGALTGFASTFTSTSRQIDRQERDVRRGIYGDYLAAALRLSTSGEADDAAALKTELLLMSHRLKIVAPYEIYEAGMLLYESLSLMLAETDDPGDRHARSEWFGVAVEGFSVLARADTRAPTAMTWKKAKRAVWEDLRRLSKFLAPEIAGRQPLK